MDYIVWTKLPVFLCVNVWRISQSRCLCVHVDIHMIVHVQKTLTVAVPSLDKGEGRC